MHPLLDLVHIGLSPNVSSFNLLIPAIFDMVFGDGSTVGFIVEFGDVDQSPFNC